MEFLGFKAGRSQRRGAVPAPPGILLACLLILGPAAANGQSAREAQVKAAFLYNFAQFTEWPPEAFAQPDSPLVIGVLGEDPFGEALDTTIRGEAVRGHKLQLKRFRAVAELPTCHIVYIGRSEANRLSQVLKALNGKPILTVSDLDGSAERGVTIQFVTEHGRVRFRINPKTAENAKLALSSKLLRVAEIVGSEKK
jgi:hypothetical protein